MATSKATPADYLNIFLSRPASFIPKGAQWAVFFHDLSKKILPALTLAYKREPGGNDAWSTEQDAAGILISDYQTKFGCFFCTAIGIPGDGGQPIAEGDIKHGGLIRSHVGAGRNDFPALKMSFIDTNVSFADTFLRGWSLATNHFGMIARDGDKNYRTTATLFKFGISPTGPFVLSTYTFDGICCTSVSSEELNYDPPSGYVRREAEFSYHSYSLIASSKLASIPYIATPNSTRSVDKPNYGADEALQSDPYGVYAALKSDTVYGVKIR